MTFDTLLFDTVTEYIRKGSSRAENMETEGSAAVKSGKPSATTLYLSLHWSMASAVCQAVSDRVHAI